MKLLGFKRWQFIGNMWLPLEDPSSQNGTPIQTLVKEDIPFDFSDDPDAPRQVIVSSEPMPQLATITFIRDKFGNQPMPESEWTITSVKPVISIFGRREVYRMQAALKTQPDFGYEGIVRP